MHVCFLQASAPLALAKDSKVSNGEEGFAPVLEARCKLYKLVDMEKKEGEEGQTQKKYKECGEGPLRLLAPKAAAGAEAGTAQTLSRLVMRRAEIKSVILNSVLGKLSTVNKQGDKGLRFACMGEGMKLESYFFKVHSSPRLLLAVFRLVSYTCSCRCSSKHSSMTES
jgi:hypothetical protein